MRLGIDFGTTRIVVAAADRGNYPLVSFDTGDAAADWFPPVVALRGGQRLYGWDAWNAQVEPGVVVVRSLKRYLEDAGTETELDTGGGRVSLMALLTGLAEELRRQLAAQYGAAETFEIMLGVPALANSNQRFLTVEAFRKAGFEVLGLLNEPSAASIEYGHRHRSPREILRMLVYDLGGGTFDASLVELGEQAHTVLATQSLARVGGDDFDRILAELAVGPERLEQLAPAALFRLEEECRRQKEALHPNSRRIVVDLDAVEEGMGQVTVPVAEFYERCRPLLEDTLAATARLASIEDVDVLYVTGGGSEMPLVARVLREEFGRKVKRSEYTRSATAIGLAIQADASAGYTLREVFTRHFGVWREAEAGRTIVVDPIFPAGTRLPAKDEPPASVVRQYSPAHNIGHFRYLESTEVLANGQPAGDIAVWDEILFPFDPALRDAALENVAVERCGVAAGQRIQESYTCDAAGSVTVSIANLTAGYSRQYRLGRWSGKPAVVKPSARRRSRKASG
jgi:molecular chaperone DnaK